MSKIRIKLEKRTKEELKSYIDGYDKALKDIKHFMKYYSYTVEEAIVECETRSQFMHDIKEVNDDR